MRGAIAMVIVVSTEKVKTSDESVLLDLEAIAGLT